MCARAFAGDWSRILSATRRREGSVALRSCPNSSSLDTSAAATQEHHSVLAKQSLSPKIAGRHTCIGAENKVTANRFAAQAVLVLMRDAPCGKLLDFTGSLTDLIGAMQRFSIGFPATACLGSPRGHPVLANGGNGRMPAVILSLPSAALEIASLTLLDRLIVAIHRAGAGPIAIISSTRLPELNRSQALGIKFEIASDWPEIPGPTLVASANLLVQPPDLRRCMETRTRLLSNRGEPLPVGVAQRTASGGGLILDGVPCTPAEGVACLVVDPQSARGAEQALWASLASSSDGFIDRAFNRPCGRVLSKLLIHTAVSPNFVSAASILLGLVAAWGFAVGSHASTVLGAVLLQLSAVVDCVDGDLARVLFKESALGKWLDLAGDQVVHVSVFAALALGMFRAGEGAVVLWLGASAVAGALISFGVVVRGMRSRSAGNGRLQALIDAATNRDFSVLLLVLASMQQLEVFLWMTAIGSHVFWIAALGLQTGFGFRRRLRL